MAAIALTGCGKAADPQSAAPKPGIMKLESVEPIEAPAAASLIPNGSFETWRKGAGAPEGWQAPESDYSTVTMELNKKADGKISLVQEWKKTDAGRSVFKLFGIRISDLAPATTYELRVKAMSLSANPALITAWQLIKNAPDAKEEWKIQRLALGFVTVPPQAGDEAFKEFGGRFSTGPETPTIVLLTATSDLKNAETRSVVVWDDWRLQEVDPTEAKAPEAKPAEKKAPEARAPEKK
jgi:hypothetical protein